MIYFVVDKLGGITGGDQAASDILTCLRLTTQTITVVSRSRGRVSNQIDGMFTGPVAWLRPPRYVAFPGRLDRRVFKRLAKWVIWNLRDLPLHYHFVRCLRRDNPELILFNDFPHPESSIGRRLTKSKKAALVVHMTPESLAFYQHSFDSSYTEGWLLRALAAFESLIFVSEPARREWLAITPLPLEKTYVISNTCREAEVQRLLLKDKRVLREQLGLAPDDYIVACIASLQPRKGQDLLIDALAGWSRAIPNFKLLLVGLDAGEWATKLRERVAALGLSSYVEFTGARTDAMTFTYAADLFVFPTRAEAQGIAVLEAMALKIPIVATSVGGVPELIEDGKSGVLVARDDHVALAAAVVKLYTDPALAKQLSERASERYWSHFSRAQQIERYNQVIQRIIAS